MNSKDIACISVKVLSIYFIMKGLTDGTLYLGNRLMIYSDWHSNLDLSLFFAMFSHVLYLIVGIILWFKTEKISNFIIPSYNTYEKKEINDCKEMLVDIQTLALSLIGLIIVFFNFQVLGDGLALVYTQNGMMEDSLNLLKWRIGFKIITIIFGLILFLKARKIASLLKTI